MARKTAIAPGSMPAHILPFTVVTGGQRPSEAAADRDLQSMLDDLTSLYQSRPRGARFIHDVIRDVLDHE